METSDIKRKLKPVKTTLGIGLLLFGLYSLAPLLDGAVNIRDTVLGAMAVAWAIYFLLTSFDVACTQCNLFLKDSGTLVADADCDSMAAALNTGDLYKVVSLLGTSDIPPSPEIGDTRLLLALSCCDKCRTVARMRLMTVSHRGHRGNQKVEELVGWQSFSDEQIAVVLNVVISRNEQQMIVDFNAATA